MLTLVLSTLNWSSDVFLGLKDRQTRLSNGLVSRSILNNSSSVKNPKVWFSKCAAINILYSSTCNSFQAIRVHLAITSSVCIRLV